MKTIKRYLWPLFCCWFVFVPLVAILIYPWYYGVFCNLVLGTATFFAFTLWFYKRSANRRDRIIHYLILFSPMLAFTLFYLWRGPDSYRSSIHCVLAPVFGSLSGIIFIWSKSFKIRVIVVTVALLTTVWACMVIIEKWYNYWNVLYYHQKYNIETGNVYEDAPSFSFAKDSLTLDNEKLRGKTVIIDFWGRSCGPCFKALPKYIELKSKYNSNKNIVFVLVNLPYKMETLHQADSTLKSHGFNIHTFLGPNSTEAFEKLKIASMPITWVINKEGKLIYRGDIEEVEEIIKTTGM